MQKIMNHQIMKGVRHEQSGGCNAIVQELLQCALYVRVKA